MAPSEAVALRKESVDRNDKSKKSKMEKRKSLSARRAWIEIEAPTKQADSHAVALRKESVDRNEKFEGVIATKEYVALRKESVDRNTLPKNPMISIDSRSPQGERG